MSEPDSPLEASVRVRDHQRRAMTMPVFLVREMMVRGMLVALMLSLTFVGKLIVSSLQSQGKPRASNGASPDGKNLIHRLVKFEN